MRFYYPFNLAATLLLASLLSVNAYAQDTLDLAYELVASETAEGDSVKIQYSLTLDRLDPTQAVDPSQLPHYRIFISHGDGTFEKDMIFDTEIPGKIEVRENEVIYSTTHAFYAIPTQPVFASVARIKTTDNDPPPKINGLNIHTWLQADRDSLNPEQLKIVGELKKLGTTAENYKFFDIPDEAESTNGAEEGAATEPAADNLHLNFHLGPVANNDYIGVLEVKGIDSVIDAGSIFVHYNLSSFTAEDDEFLIDSNYIMRWKSETVQLKSFEELYPNADPDLMDFKDVIRIDFRGLEVNEVRRIILPFQCPASLTGNLDEPVYFHAVVIDSSRVEDYIPGVKGDIIDPIRDEGAVTENPNTGNYPGREGDKMSRPNSQIGWNALPGSEKAEGYVKAGVYSEWQEEERPAAGPADAPSAGDGLLAAAAPGEAFYLPKAAAWEAPTVQFASEERNITTTSIVPKEYLVDDANGEPLSQTAEIKESFREQLSSLGGTIVSDVLVLDYVREAHDPNSLELSPDCFGTSPKIIEGVVNVENYGFLGARRIIIKIRLNNQVNPNSFQLFKTSFGEAARVDERLENGYYVVEISNIYLPGVLELASEGGLVKIGEEAPIDEDGMEELRVEVLNKYGAISQGHIVFQARTRRLFGAYRPLRMDAEIIFEGQEAISAADTILYNPVSCGGFRPFLRVSARLGYNYMLPFENFGPNYDFADNYTLGGFLDFSPHFNSRLYYRLEGNYNRWGFEEDGTILRHTSIEIAPLIRYALGRRWSVGAGPSFLRQVKWELEDNKPLPFTFDQNQVGGVFDLAYNNLRRRISIGLRAQYYPNAIQVDSNDESLKGAQAYFAYRIF